MARSKLPSITVLVERMRCPMELSHSRVDTQGSLKLRRRWKQSADRCWLKPWEQVSFRVRTVNTKKSVWPRTEHPPKGKTKENARKQSWRREPQEIITEAKSRVSPRDQSYMLALDSLREANSGVSSGKLRAVSEGIGLGLRGDCPVTGTEEAQSTAIRSCPYHLLMDQRKPHSQAHLHSPPHASSKAIPSFTKLSSLPFYFRGSTVQPWYLWVIVTSFCGYWRRTVVSLILEHL